MTVTYSVEEVEVVDREKRYESYGAGGEQSFTIESDKDPNFDDKNTFMPAELFRYAASHYAGEFAKERNAEGLSRPKLEGNGVLADDTHVLDFTVLETVDGELVPFHIYKHLYDIKNEYVPAEDDDAAQAQNFDDAEKAVAQKKEDEAKAKREVAEKNAAGNTAKQAAGAAGAKTEAEQTVDEPANPTDPTFKPEAKPSTKGTDGVKKDEPPKNNQSGKPKNAVS